MVMITSDRDIARYGMITSDRDIARYGMMIRVRDIAKYGNDFESKSYCQIWYDYK